MHRLNQRNPRVNVDQFSMVPRADIPRSTFQTHHTHKTTFQGGNLIPVLVKEILPGDSFHITLTLFARLNTLLFPIMDHITLESFGFFTPIRLVWPNFTKMMGEQEDPNDSISYTIPVCQSPNGGYAVYSVQDYMGLPTAGQMDGGNAYTHNNLPLRAHNLIWNEWFRDQNLQDSKVVDKDDGPDTAADYVLQQRNKKHDYFTSALPWPLKGGVSVSLPLGTRAPVRGIGKINQEFPNASLAVYETTVGAGTYINASMVGDPDSANDHKFAVKGTAASGGLPDIYADLSQATAATINALRLAVQTQRLLERDARSGTRYTEHLKAHWGVSPEDFRLQRPEYIGGGRSSVQTQAIPQTSATGLTGGTTPAASLAATSTVAGQHRFSYQAREHGYVHIYIHADAELTYQQGVHRMWSRSTRFDIYIPVLAHLGEQAIRKDEIFVQGTSADSETWAYQERWAEYRHEPSRISGAFRSTSNGNIDEWHSAQQFTGLPTFNTDFIVSNPPFSRNLAAGTAANNQQFLADMLFDITITRAMPMRSVPGGMDRF